MTDCNTCRFRFMVNKQAFHCAAHFGPRGYAYLWPVKPKWRHPVDCKHWALGDAVFIGHEMKAEEFWVAAGKRIREEDWERWKK